MERDIVLENQALKRQLAELMERARYNEQVLARFQKVELRLIGIVSFKELIEARAAIPFREDPVDDGARGLVGFADVDVAAQDRSR